MAEEADGSAAIVTAAPDMDRAGEGGGRVPCPSGEHLIRPASTACESCNAKVATQCDRCRKDLRAGARFCDSCGEPVAAGSAPATGPALPASFGDARYQVKRFLGEGGRKRVYLAHDTRLERDVAVAVVKTEGLDEAGLARIRREARVMARLGDQANVVTIYDVGNDNGGSIS